MAMRLQFSLRYLLVELLLLAVAMGCTRALIVWPSQLPDDPLLYFGIIAYMLCAVVAAGCWGAAIGGLFGGMKAGGRFVAYLLLMFLMLVILFAT